MNPVALLQQSLRIQPDDILQIEAMTPPTLNMAWRFKLNGQGHCFFLKVQGGQGYSKTVRDEAEVLVILHGRIPKIPKLISHGIDSQSGKPYFVTQEIRGESLHQSILAGIDSSEFCSISDSLIDWYFQLQSVQQLRTVLERRSIRDIGVYSPCFNPIGYSQILLNNLKKKNSLLLPVFRKRLLDVARNWTVSEPEIIHGSLTTFNLLASTACRRRSLMGVIDFEATRLGNLMFDAALFLLYLLMSPKPEFAESWLERACEVFGRKRTLTRAIAFFIYLILARYQVQDSNEQIETPENRRISNFLKQFN